MAHTTCNFAQVVRPRELAACSFGTPTGIGAAALQLASFYRYREDERVPQVVDGVMPYSR